MRLFSSEPRARTSKAEPTRSFDLSYCSLHHLRSNPRCRLWWFLARLIFKIRCAVWPSALGQAGSRLPPAAMSWLTDGVYWSHLALLSGSTLFHKKFPRVDGEFHCSSLIGVPCLHDAQGLPDVFGLYRDHEASCSAAYLYRDLYHLDHLLRTYLDHRRVFLYVSHPPPLRSVEPILVTLSVSRDLLRVASEDVGLYE